jgi:hypothetical protein
MVPFLIRFAKVHNGIQHVILLVLVFAIAFFLPDNLRIASLCSLDKHPHLSGCNSNRICGNSTTGLWVQLVE